MLPEDTSETIILTQLLVTYVPYTTKPMWKKTFAILTDFLRTAKVFLLICKCYSECQYTYIQKVVLKAKPQKFSLHYDKIQ